MPFLFFVFFPNIFFLLTREFLFFPFLPLYYYYSRVSLCIFFPLFTLLSFFPSLIFLLCSFIYLFLLVPFLCAFPCLFCALTLFLCCFDMFRVSTPQDPSGWSPVAQRPRVNVFVITPVTAYCRDRSSAS
jgi:hypothetical protein